jgi:hypothetical protein
MDYYLLGKTPQPLQKPAEKTGSEHD